MDIITIIHSIFPQNKKSIFISAQTVLTKYSGIRGIGKLVKILTMQHCVNNYLAYGRYDSEGKVDDWSYIRAIFRKMSHAKIASDQTIRKSTIDFAREIWNFCTVIESSSRDTKLANSVGFQRILADKKMSFADAEMWVNHGSIPDMVIEKMANLSPAGGEIRNAQVPLAKPTPVALRTIEQNLSTARQATPVLRPIVQNFSHGRTKSASIRIIEGRPKIVGEEK